MDQKKVIVGMSGGVDSAVAALLLKEAGYEVVGLTLRTWVSSTGEESRCCEIDSARAVCRKIKIPYYTLNCLQDFEEKITQPFVRCYCNGMTPNPCVLCNRLIKWQHLLHMADILGAEYVATGHYARILPVKNGRLTVQQAAFGEKDQSYMLYRLTQEQLARTLMPLGRFSKKEVREIASQAGLPDAQKPDSQEICFVTGGRSYADYIQENADISLPGEGNFIDENGKVLGRHKGIIHYTVGQRKGLGLALGTPAYVKKICAETNEVMLGKEEALFSRVVLCEDLNYMSIPELQEGEGIDATVKIRYHHKGEKATVVKDGNDGARILFDIPVKAATPGQSAVFYDENRCIIGGGIIRDVVF